MKNFSLLALTKQDENLIAKINRICYNYNIDINIVFDLCDLFDDISNKNYDFLILDDRIFPTDSNLLKLFQRKNYYVPNVIILSDKDNVFEEANISNFKVQAIDKLEQFIFKYIKSCENNLTKSDSEFKNFIYLNLCELGFSQRYKGFNYLIEIIDRMFNSVHSGKSFKKYMYPYIASLYNVTEESVERDVRNILKINYNKFSFRKNINFNDRQLSPTTRNIIDTIVVYLKSKL